MIYIMMSIREKELRERLKAIFGNSSYADETIEVIVNCQLDKWGEEEMAAYRRQKKEEFEKALEQMGEPIPLEAQTYYKVGEYYSNIVNDGECKKDGETDTEESGIQRSGELCGDKIDISIHEKQ
jgi:hypothetical protein